MKFIKIDNTYIIIEKIVFFEYTPIKKAEKTTIPKEAQMFGVTTPHDTPASLVVGLVGLEPKRFSGNCADEGFEQLKNSIAN